MAAKSHKANSGSKPKTQNVKNEKVQTKNFFGMEVPVYLADILEVIIPALALFFIIHIFVAEARFVPSPSMVPTIEIGDRFLVEKVSYRFHQPVRGDIVVFKPPVEAVEKARQYNQMQLDDFIKRIIGVPGDTVAVHDGKVIINGKVLSEPYISSEQRPVYEYGPVKVPIGQYLVLGDNRNHSWDGHVWGFVPGKNIIGHAIWRFWPLNRVGIFN